MTNPRVSVSVPSFVLSVWLCLISAQRVSAHQAKALAKRTVAKTLVCSKDSKGVEHCTEKLSGGVIAAIVVVVVGIILLIVTVFYFLMRSRQKVVDAELQVEPSQMQGPPPIIGVSAAPTSRRKRQANTTYAANYDPGLPQLAYAHGSAPVLSLSGGGPPSAPIAARMGPGSAMGYGPGSAGPYTPPQTAPNGKSFGQGKSPYPFVGISSSQLPPMPHAGPSYASGGYAGNRI